MKPSTPLFTTIATIGMVILLATGALIYLADWLGVWHLTRVLLQVGSSFAGAALVATAALVPSLTRLRRIVVSVAGLLLILAVLDSLDGRQDILPLVAILLVAWALSYADITAQLLETGPPATLRRWLAVVLGLLATLAYLGAAGYYAIVNLTVAPVTFDHHPLFGFGFLITMLLRSIGEIRPYGGPLTGKIRICPACGLRNIYERQTCKRCGTQLGPLQHVS